jgi:glucose/arabinose dehydrogenase
MCEPTTLMAVSLAISAASAGAAHVGQARSAKVQQQSINDNLRAQDEATQAQAVERDQAASQQMSERARQAMIERGRLVAAFGSTGVAGGSQVGAINESNFSEVTDLVAMEANRMAGAQQGSRQAASAYRQAGQSSAAIHRPDFLTTGLQIAGGAVNAAGTYADRTRIR